MSEGALPAINPAELGTIKSVDIDALLIPYLIGLVGELCTPSAFYGDSEDIIETVLQFELIKAALTEALQP